MPETDPYSPTTERLDIPDTWPSAGDYLVYLFHIKAYEFAAERLVATARVLDFGCGTGYGAFELAESGRNVVGVDVSESAVRYAAERYRSHNVEFASIQPVEEAPLPFDDESFDAVLSFQVIEHVPSVDAYLAEVARVLRPGGAFLCATPDRETRLFRRQRPWNRWHVEEFSQHGLAESVTRHLEVDEVMGMTAPANVVDLELRRARLMRVISMPFTFPGSPEPWRVAGIETLRRGARAVGAARSRFDAGRGVFARTGAPEVSYPFGPDDIFIAPDAHPSTNTLLTATKRLAGSQ